VKGGVIVLDPPAVLPEGAVVEVATVLETNPGAAGRLLDLIDQLDRLPGDPDWPEDAAAQHDHYLYGAPKRP
jgi:hypothetical protein